MAPKRKKPSNNGSLSKQNNNQKQKRARTSLDHDADGGDGEGIKFDKAGGFIDPSTGQRGAFPGLENYGEDFYGPPADGIEYLRMVRSEAKGVPDLLLAPHIHISNRPPVSKPLPPLATSSGGCVDDVVLDYDEPPREEEGEEQEKKQVEDGDNCYFTESTYISLHPSLPCSAVPAFHAPLLRRFKDLRQRLAANPPRGSNSRPFPRWHDSRAWRTLLSSTPPKLCWIWSMQQWEVVRLLGDVAGWLEWRTKVRNARGRGLPRLWGAWCWALLVRCHDVMVAEDAAVVRELGKVAVRMRAGMVVEDEEHEDETEGGKDNREELEEGGVAGTEDTKDEEIKEEPAQEDGEEGEAIVPKMPGVVFYSREDSISMLDVIISLVGDFFGQRDLLEERAATGGL